MKNTIYILLCFLLLTKANGQDIILNDGSIKNTSTSTNGIRIDNDGKTILENGIDPKNQDFYFPDTISKNRGARVLTSRDGEGNAIWDNPFNKTLTIGVKNGTNVDVMSFSKKVYSANYIVNKALTESNPNEQTFKDLSDALNHAIAQGYTKIKLLEGQYNVTSSINIPRDGIFIEGSGALTQLENINNNAISIFTINADYFRLENLSFKVSTNYILSFQNSNYSKINNVTFGLYTNIETTNPQNKAILINPNSSFRFNQFSNIFFNSFNNAIVLNSSNGGFIESNTFENININFVNRFVEFIGININNNTFKKLKVQYNVHLAERKFAIAISGNNNKFIDLTTADYSNLTANDLLIEVSSSAINTLIENCEVSLSTPPNLSKYCINNGINTQFINNASGNRSNFFQVKNIQKYSLENSNQTIKDFGWIMLGGTHNILETVIHTYNLKLNSNLNYNNGTNLNNKVLTSSGSSGEAVWAIPQENPLNLYLGLNIVNDNLGNHLALNNLNLNTFKVLNSSTSSNGIVINANQDVEVNQLKIAEGSQLNKVLLSDENGNASWQNYPGVAPSDNFGNHQATSNLMLNNYKIVNNPNALNGISVSNSFDSSGNEFSTVKIAENNLFNSGSYLSFGNFKNNSSSSTSLNSHISLVDGYGWQSGFGVTNNEFTISSRNSAINFHLNSAVNFYITSNSVELSNNILFKAPFVNFTNSSKVYTKPNKILFKNYYGLSGIDFSSENNISKLSIVNNCSGATTDFITSNNGSSPVSGLYMNRNGSIFINTNYGNYDKVYTSPSSVALGVRGSIKCMSLFTNEDVNTMPDYVFESNYNLKPLNQVEKYIKRYKHLENIPSAKEVEKNGINVDKMSKNLLEKVEELTLYVIEQDKKIKDKRTKIDELKKMLSEVN